MTLVSLKPLAGIPGQGLLGQGLKEGRGFPSISLGLFLTLSSMTTQPVVVLLVDMVVQLSLREKPGASVAVPGASSLLNWSWCPENSLVQL